MKVEEEIKPTGESRQIERQEPGTLRELDCAVAERVMGWQRQPNYNYWMTFSATGETFNLHALIATWKPSEDMRAAMQVVEKISERGFQVSIRSWEGVVPWSVKFISCRSKEEVEEDGANLPEAICRAALKVAGVPTL